MRLLATSLFALIFAGMAVAQAIVPDRTYFDSNSRLFVTLNDTAKSVYQIDAEHNIHHLGNEQNFTLGLQGPALIMMQHNESVWSKRVYVDDEGPNIDIVTPVSGSMVPFGNVSVTGDAFDSGSGLSKILYKEQELDINNGRFSTTDVVSHGLNSLLVMAQDHAGLWSKLTSNIYASNRWQKTELKPDEAKPDNIEIKIGSDLFRRLVDKRQIDALADKITEQLTQIQGSKEHLFSETLFSPCSSINLKVDGYLEHFDTAAVVFSSMDLENGGIRVRGKFSEKNGYNARAVIHALANVYFFQTSVTVGQYYVQADLTGMEFSFKLTLSKNPGSSFNLGIEEFAINNAASVKIKPAGSNNTSTITQRLLQNAINNAFSNKDGTAEKIMAFLNDKIKASEINQLKTQITESFPFIDFSASLQSLSIKNDSISIGIGTWASPQTKPTDLAPIILWNGCDEGKVYGATQIEPNQAHVRIRQDAINQIFHALWQAKAFTFNLGPDVFKFYLDISTIGIEDVSAHISFTMPPIIHDCNKDNKLVLQTGDIDVQVSLKMYGRPIRFDARASIAAHIDFENESNLALLVQNFELISFDVIDISEGTATDRALIETLFLDYIGPAFAKGKFRLPFVARTLPSINIPYFLINATHSVLFDQATILLSAGAIDMRANLEMPPSRKPPTLTQNSLNSDIVDIGVFGGKGFFANKPHLKTIN